MVNSFCKRILSLFTMILLLGSFYLGSTANASSIPIHTPLIIGQEGSGNGEFFYPSGVAIDSSGNIYVADTYNNRIQKFNSDGTWQKSWGTNGSGNGQFNLPAGIAVDDSGNVYVADTSNHRIQKFNSDGIWQKSWGSYGIGNGQFAYPRGVAVDYNGNVYVADTANNRIQKFNSNGIWQNSWGSYGRGDKPNQLSQPSGISVDLRGIIWVADTGNNRVESWSPTGESVNSYGFFTPFGIDFKNSYRLGSDAFGFVADASQNRIDYLDSYGPSLSFRLNFSSPLGVASDTSRNIYVADTGNNRIVIYHLNPFSVSDEPLEKNITVTNNPSPIPDSVVVNGLNFGDVVNVYDASYNGNLLGSATVVVPEQTSATVPVNQLGKGAGTVYVSVTSIGEVESTRTAKSYTAEPVQTSAPLAKTITVTNNPAPTPDTVAVMELHEGDVVKVYNAATDGTLLGTATVATGQTTATVSTSQLGTSSGTVYVSVTSVGETESTRTQVSYSAEPITAPAITTQPSDATVNAGSNTSYTVTASGNNLTYQWQVNAGSVYSNITDGGVYSGVTTATLTITGTTAEMNGYHYKVIVAGTGGVTESNSAGLTVKPAPIAPTISIQPTNQTVTAGQTATFTVSANGDAPLSYQWKKDGINISGATSVTLSIASAQLGDAGSYTVVVTNGAGNVTSNEATLTVNPSISPAPSVSNITVTNNVYGTPDTVVVSELNSGDVIKVYNAETGGKLLGTATVSNGQRSATVSIAQLGTRAGTVYVSVTNTGKMESTRTEKAYNAEPNTTPPVTKYHINPIYGTTSKGNPYIKGLTISLQATPGAPNTTVTETVFQINGGSWTEYTGPFSVMAGVTHTVEYYSKDSAGHQEQPNIMNFDTGRFTGNGSY